MEKKKYINNFFFFLFLNIFYVNELDLSYYILKKNNPKKL
jgi:hypothetical protein